MKRVGKPALALTLLVAAYVLIFLRLQNQWWFEDDPYQMAITSTHRPWEFFVSKASLSRGLIGLLFTPLQNLTYWFDQRVAPRSVEFAYLHTAVSLALGTLMLFAVLRRWLSDSAAATTTALCLLLPSTIVCAEFISLHNYLDGFVLSLAAIWLAQRATDATGLRSAVLAAAAVACYLLGGLAKEVYVTTPFALMMLMFVWKRRPVAAAILGLGGLIYVGYYRWMMGSLTSTFDVPTLSAGEYPGFLVRYPYIFAGGPWGWGLTLVWSAAIGYGIRRRWMGWRDVMLAGCLVLVSIGTLHPAAGALDHAYATRGTWYRAAFVSNVVIVCVASWLAASLPLWWRRALAVGAALGLACGASATERTWHDLHARYALEGRFYLANPDKLLYSELPAWWFMVGLDDLYRVPSRHYLLAARPSQPGDAGLLHAFGSVWRYSPAGGGRFEPAPDLYGQLLR